MEEFKVINRRRNLAYINACATESQAVHSTNAVIFNQTTNGVTNYDY